jgi:hypothetical protein
MDPMSARALPPDVNSALDLYIATKINQARQNPAQASELSNLKQRSADVETRIESLYTFIRNSKAQISFATQDIDDHLKAVSDPQSNPYNDTGWLKDTEQKLTSECCKEMQSQQQQRLLRRGRSGGFSRRGGR